MASPDVNVGNRTAFPDFDPHMLEFCAGFKEITVDSRQPL